MDRLIEPIEEPDEQQHVSTAGSYVINAAYILLFFLAYLWVFYELSHRWPVR